MIVSPHFPTFGAERGGHDRVVTAGAVAARTSGRLGSQEINGGVS
jgi:hypothetical protein